MYAEYGYTLLDQSDINGAIAYFSKERQAWPESAQLMEKIIAKLSKPVGGEAAGAASLQSKDGVGGK